MIQLRIYIHLLFFSFFLHKVISKYSVEFLILYRRPLLIFYFIGSSVYMLGFPGGTSGKETACQCRRCKRCSFNPWVGKMPWKRAWQPTPVFLPGGSHGQRNLAHYSPWGRKELDMTEATEQAHTQCICVNPNIIIYPFPPPNISPLVIINLFSISVSLFLFYK